MIDNGPDYFRHARPALLTKAEVEWLIGNIQPASKGYERFLRHSINRKLQTFAKLELPLLIKAGYILDNGVSTDTNAVRIRTNALNPDSLKNERKKEPRAGFGPATSTLPR